MSSQVLGSSTVQTPSRDRAEFIFDTLGYVVGIVGLMVRHGT